MKKKGDKSEAHTRQIRTRRLRTRFIFGHRGGAKNTFLVVPANYVINKTFQGGGEIRYYIATRFDSEIRQKTCRAIWSDHKVSKKLPPKPNQLIPEGGRDTRRGERTKVFVCVGKRCCLVGGTMSQEGGGEGRRCTKENKAKQQEGGKGWVGFYKPSLGCLERNNKGETGEVCGELGRSSGTMPARLGTREMNEGHRKKSFDTTQ